MERKFQHAGPLKGEILVPGDKSISHRSIMFGALAEGTTRITHFLQGADCLSTIACFRSMGIEITFSGTDEVLVKGQGLDGLQKPSSVLNVGNSGTTTRLISGILAGQTFDSIVDGDASIRKRPMERIITPLTQMGGQIRTARNSGCAPLSIHGSSLTGIHYISPVASAQVKSCVLLAGLYADGRTSVTEPVVSRDHTERMLGGFGAEILREGKTVTIGSRPRLTAQDIPVPGDISSAAYFIAAALLIPGSEVLVKGVGVNPTRDGILRVFKAMGADIETVAHHEAGGEPSEDLLVRSSPLHGTVVEGDIIPTLIDEIPMIAVAASFADGQTIIRDAAELKVKESDRIAVMTENLRSMGVDITPTEDGMIINGGKTPHGACIRTYDDHRIAMSFAVAGLAAQGVTTIDNAACASISYPAFYEDLSALMR